MNVALIFAGGSGSRMNNKSRPKQFLELHNKPIIIYTLEVFERHEMVDAIVVVCIESWIKRFEAMLQKFGITKVKCVVAGGSCGQDSIYNGLVATEELFGEGATVLIHDGVRPLIDEDTISRNIESVERHGNCITCVEPIETVIISDSERGNYIPQRSDVLVARAPQSFRINDIIAAHRQAIAEGRHDHIDSCSLMKHYGHQLATTHGSMENIKVTTPTDFFIFKAIVELRLSAEALGI
ncbi:MAG: IspD/TarI family cytidylyltransferase [Rikenellaceae bacterium]